MILNISNIGVIHNAKGQPAIRSSVSFRERGEDYSAITVHGWLYGRTRIPTPPKSRSESGKYWNIIDVDDRHFKAIKEFLDSNEDIQQIIQFAREQEDDRKSTLKSLGMGDKEIEA